MERYYAMVRTKKWNFQRWKGITQWYKQKAFIAVLWQYVYSRDYNIGLSNLVYRGFCAKAFLALESVKALIAQIYEINAHAQIYAHSEGLLLVLY